MELGHVVLASPKWTSKNRPDRNAKVTISKKYRYGPTLKKPVVGTIEIIQHGPEHLPTLWDIGQNFPDKKSENISKKISSK